LRFVRHQVKHQQPVVIINRGPTRGDDLATVKIDSGCSETLSEIRETLLERQSMRPELVEALGPHHLQLVEHVSKHVADAAADVAGAIADPTHEITDPLADSGEHVAHAAEQQAADQHA